MNVLRLSRTAIALLITTVFFTSCVKNEYYTTEPDPPAGYQHIFNDDFDYDNHNWSFNDPVNNASVDIGGGTLRYIYDPVNAGTNTVAIDPGADLRYDFLIQARIKSDNAMGLAFGVSNSDYGYSMFIDDQGYFAVYKEGDANTQVSTLIDWQFSSAIRAGWNDVEMEQINGYWVGYANGTKLFEIPAKTLRGYKIGFIVLSNTVGYADYLTVQW